VAWFAGFNLIVKFRSESHCAGDQAVGWWRVAGCHYTNMVKLTEYGKEIFGI